MTLTTIAKSGIHGHTWKDAANGLLWDSLKYLDDEAAKRKFEERLNKDNGR